MNIKKPYLKKLPLYCRIRITELVRQQCPIPRIVDILRRENYYTTFRGVKKYIARHTVRKNHADLKRAGRPSKYGDTKKVIDFLLERNNELTSYQIKIRLQTGDFDCPVPSERTIRKLRGELGWKHANVQYCQIVCHANKRKRLLFCRDSILKNEQFQRHVFTDECTIQLERHKRKIFVKPGQKLMAIKSKAKHPVKIHVWAGISWEGATSICIFDGKICMNSAMYCEILEKFYRPFAEKAYGSDCILVQDNAPMHTSRVTIKYLVDNGVNVMDWPPESPDLNTIECVWHQLKHHLRENVQPSNKSELISGVIDFWQSAMTVDQCRNYVQHIFTVMPKVLTQQGGPSGC